jgi:hypothetical protein
MRKAQILHVKAFDIGIDKSDWVLLTDIIIEGFREQSHRLSFASFDVPDHHPPARQIEQLDLPYLTLDFSHSLSLKLTRRAAPSLKFAQLAGVP